MAGRNEPCNCINKSKVILRRINCSYGCDNLSFSIKAELVDKKPPVTRDVSELLQVDPTIDRNAFGCIANIILHDVPDPLRHAQDLPDLLMVVLPLRENICAGKKRNSSAQHHWNAVSHQGAQHTDTLCLGRMQMYQINSFTLADPPDLKCRHNIQRTGKTHRITAKAAFTRKFLQLRTLFHCEYAGHVSQRKIVQQISELLLATTPPFLRTHVKYPHITVY